MAFMRSREPPSEFRLPDFPPKFDYFRIGLDVQRCSCRLRDLPRLRAGGNPAERRKLLLTMLDAVYVEAKQEKRIVAIKPKPPFQPVFQVAAAKEGSGVMLLNEPPEDSPEARSCFWWRRGRVELPVQRNLLKTCYRLS